MRHPRLSCRARRYAAHQRESRAEADVPHAGQLKTSRDIRPALDGAATGSDVEVGGAAGRREDPSAVCCVPKPVRAQLEAITRGYSVVMMALCQWDAAPWTRIRCASSRRRTASGV